MRRTFSLLGAFAGLLLALLVGAPSAHAAYTPQIPTTCSINPSSPSAGQAVNLGVEIGATGSTPVTGVVDVSITRGNDEIFSQTVNYNGAPITINGPALPAGSYQAALDFTPDDTAAFSGCSAVAGIDVAGATTGSVGGLANTGGPHLYLLVLGLALVAGGATVVTRSRVRQTA